MLSKEELKLHNFQFWSDFKLYMAPFRSSTGKRINWLNYPTEIKAIFLRLHADKKNASISFDIQYKDETVRAVFWEQLHELKNVLLASMQDEGIWTYQASNEAISSFCKIEWKLENVNYLKPNDKDQIFDFFKTKLLTFDEFYQEFKEILLFLAK